MNNVIWNSSSLITPSAKSSKKESKTSREGKKKNDVDLWSFVDNADPLGRKVHTVDRSTLTRHIFGGAKTRSNASDATKYANAVVSTAIRYVPKGIRHVELESLALVSLEIVSSMLKSVPKAEIKYKTKWILSRCASAYKGDGLAVRNIVSTILWINRALRKSRKDIALTCVELLSLLEEGFPGVGEHARKELNESVVSRKKSVSMSLLLEIMLLACVATTLDPVRVASVGSSVRVMLDVVDRVTKEASLKKNPVVKTVEANSLWSLCGLLKVSGRARRVFGNYNGAICIAKVLQRTTAGEAFVPGLNLLGIYMRSEEFMPQKDSFRTFLSSCKFLDLLIERARVMGKRNNGALMRALASFLPCIMNVSDHISLHLRVRDATNYERCVEVLTLAVAGYAKYRSLVVSEAVPFLLRGIVSHSMVSDCVGPTLRVLDALFAPYHPDMHLRNSVRLLVDSHKFLDAMLTLLDRKDMYIEDECLLFCIIARAVRICSLSEAESRTKKNSPPPPGRLETAHHKSTLQDFLKYRVVEETVLAWKKRSSDIVVIMRDRALLCRSCSELLCLLSFRWEDHKAERESIPVAYVDIMSRLCEPVIAEYFTSDEKDPRRAYLSCSDEDAALHASAIASAFRLAMIIYHQEDRSKSRGAVCRSIVLGSNVVDSAMNVIDSKLSQKFPDLIRDATFVLEVALPKTWTKAINCVDTPKDARDVDFFPERAKEGGLLLASPPPGRVRTPRGVVATPRLSSPRRVFATPPPHVDSAPPGRRPRKLSAGSSDFVKEARDSDPTRLPSDMLNIMGDVSDEEGEMGDGVGYGSAPPGTMASSTATPPASTEGNNEFGNTPPGMNEAVSSSTVSTATSSAPPGCRPRKLSADSSEFVQEVRGSIPTRLPSDMTEIMGDMAEGERKMNDDSAYDDASIPPGFLMKKSNTTIAIGTPPVSMGEFGDTCESEFDDTADYAPPGTVDALAAEVPLPLGQVSRKFSTASSEFVKDSRNSAPTHLPSDMADIMGDVVEEERRMDEENVAYGDRPPGFLRKKTASATTMPSVSAGDGGEFDVAPPGLMDQSTSKAVSTISSLPPGRRPRALSAGSAAFVNEARSSIPTHLPSDMPDILGDISEEERDLDEKVASDEMAYGEVPPGMTHPMMKGNGTLSCFLKDSKMGARVPPFITQSLASSPIPASASKEESSSARRVSFQAVNAPRSNATFASPSASPPGRRPRMMSAGSAEFVKVARDSVHTHVPSDLQDILGNISEEERELDEKVGTAPGLDNDEFVDSASLAKLPPLPFEDSENSLGFVAGEMSEENKNDTLTRTLPEGNVSFPPLKRVMSLKDIAQAKNTIVPHKDVARNICLLATAVAGAMKTLTNELQTGKTKVEELASSRILGVFVVAIQEFCALSVQYPTEANNAVAKRVNMSTWNVLCKYIKKIFNDSQLRSKAREPKYRSFLEAVYELGIIVTSAQHLIKLVETGMLELMAELDSITPGSSSEVETYSFENKMTFVVGGVEDDAERELSALERRVFREACDCLDEGSSSSSFPTARVVATMDALVIILRAKGPFEVSKMTIAVMEIWSKILSEAALKDSEIASLSFQMLSVLERICTSRRGLLCVEMASFSEVVCEWQRRRSIESNNDGKMQRVDRTCRKLVMNILAKMYAEPSSRNDREVGNLYDVMTYLQVDLICDNLYAATCVDILPRLLEECAIRVESNLKEEKEEEREDDEFSNDVLMRIIDTSFDLMSKLPVASYRGLRWYVRLMKSATRRTSCWRTPSALVEISAKAMKSLSSLLNRTGVFGTSRKSDLKALSRILVATDDWLAEMCRIQEEGALPATVEMKASRSIVLRDLCGILHIARLDLVREMHMRERKPLLLKAASALLRLLRLTPAASMMDVWFSMCKYPTGKDVPRLVETFGFADSFSLSAMTSVACVSWTIGALVNFDPKDTDEIATKFAMFVSDTCTEALDRMLKNSRSKPHQKWAILMCDVIFEISDAVIASNTTTRDTCRVWSDGSMRGTLSCLGDIFESGFRSEEIAHAALRLATSEMFANAAMTIAPEIALSIVPIASSKALHLLTRRKEFDKSLIVALEALLSPRMLEKKNERSEAAGIACLLALLKHHKGDATFSDMFQALLLTRRRIENLESHLPAFAAEALHRYTISSASLRRIRKHVVWRKPWLCSLACIAYLAVAESSVSWCDALIDSLQVVLDVATARKKALPSSLSSEERAGRRLIGTVAKDVVFVLWMTIRSVMESGDVDTARAMAQRLRERGKLYRDVERASRDARSFFAGVGLSGLCSSLLSMVSEAIDGGVEDNLSLADRPPPVPIERLNEMLLPVPVDRVVGSTKNDTTNSSNWRDSSQNGEKRDARHRDILEGGNDVEILEALFKICHDGTPPKVPRSVEKRPGASARTSPPSASRTLRTPLRGRGRKHKKSILKRLNAKRASGCS